MTQTTPDNTTVIIAGPTHGSHQPIRLNINGSAREIPTNTKVEVTADELAALNDSDHEITIVEGGTAADEAEQPPAPADSGGGGDAGGGGSSGGPATDTDDGDKTIAVVIPAEFLDRSVNAVVKDLGDKDAAFLTALRAAEDAGKTRKSLVAAIDERLAALAKA